MQQLRGLNLLAEADAITGPTACKVCGSPAEVFGEVPVLHKYNVRYFRCKQCGFVQTEPPYWLNEAYRSPISRLDVGAIRRNIVNSEIVAAVLNLLFPETSSAIDFGAGHGVLVRLLRDKGFNFFWSDLHATNNYARGFEHQGGATYGFLTAFEVLEHLSDPVAEIFRLMELSDNVFVSTCLLPEPAPPLNRWWYYSPESGQHISLYTSISLRLLAARFGRHLLSFGSYHLFTKEPKNAFLYRLATRYKTAWLINRLYRRQSLLDADHTSMQGLHHD